MPETSSRGRKHNAQRLWRVRDALGLSQREFARELGVTSGAVAQWESRKRGIPGPVLKLLELYERELGMTEHTEEGLEHIDGSWLERTSRLSRTAAGVTAQLAGAAIQSLVTQDREANPIAARTQQAVAHRFAQTLGEMKGLAMKVGQMVSFLDFALPEGARSVLEQLQHQSRPMAPSVVAGLFHEELGRSPRDLFADWSFTPIAAASIGQVHKARTHDGRLVAVKVQYPGIERALAADLANARLLDRMGTLLFQGQEPGVFIEELRERLLEECDYRREAEAVTAFASLFSGNPRMAVPSVVPALSTRRILTTEWVEGERFQAFRDRASQHEKDQAGEVIFQFAYESIFRHHRFNGDPHPGNYLFLPGKVAFLDFGCVRHFDVAFIQLWKRLARAVLERDWTVFEQAVVDLGFTRTRESFDFAYHRRMMLQLYRPWLLDEPFRFTSEFITGTWSSLLKQNPNRRRMNVPREWVFLNRLQTGLNSVLAQLGASANWRSRYLELVYRPDEPRPEPYTLRELELASG